MQFGERRVSAAGCLRQPTRRTKTRVLCDPVSLWFSFASKDTARARLIADYPPAASLSSFFIGSGRPSTTSLSPERITVSGSGLNSMLRSWR